MYLTILKKIRHAYNSKYYIKHENHVNLLMITDGEKWHYLAVKELPALPRGITSKHVGDFYCFNCFHSCSTKIIEKQYNVCKNHDYYDVEIPNEDNKI